MTTTLLAIAALATLIAISVTSFVIGRKRGHDVGYQLGRDVQRVADIQEQWRKDRARRGRDGRFTRRFAA